MSVTEHESLRRPWTVVITGFVALAVAGGIHYYVFPVYLELIRADLGASLTQVTFGVLLWGGVGAAASPFAGRAMHRFGVRRVMIGGTLLQIVSTVLLGASTSLPQLYLAFSLGAVASVFNTYMAVAAAIALRFDERRGRAMGVAMLGLSAGGLVMPLLADRLLALGWRNGYYAFAMILAGLLPVLWLGLDRTRGAGAAADPGIDPATDAGSDGASREVETSLEPDRAIRTRTFWSLGIGDGLTGLVFAFLNVHLVSLAIEGGIERTSATTFFSIFLFIMGPGTLFIGALADRFPIRGLMVLCYGSPVLVLPALLALPSPALLGLFVVVAGFFAGGRNAAFPLAIASAFGPRAVASVYGWLNVAFMIGNAVGPLLAGYLHDVGGTYEPAVVVSLGLGLASVVLISLLRDERRVVAPAAGGGV